MLLNSMGLTSHSAAGASKSDARQLDPNPYPAGTKITAQTITDLEHRGILGRHDFHGEWNYTLYPDTPGPH